MNVPEDLRYSKDHEWARLEGDRVRVGITDYAQDALGDEAYQVTGSAPADDTVSRARDRAAAAGAAKIETEAVQGKPAETLQRVVKDRGADLLVVGNRGLNTLAGRIIGSVPLDVVRHTPIDVLVVHTT